MQTTIETKTIPTNNFITPESMLQGLIASLNNPCNCGDGQVECECEQEEINEEIKSLQVEGNNIRSEIVEVEEMLRVRDQLYGELDQLREQRDQIEGEIQTAGTYEHTETVKSSGYREMNERLKRRIFQVRQYIEKMTYENQRIEQGMISHQYRQQEDEILLRREMHTNYPVYEGKRQMSSVQALIGKLHDKQEEALRRVRRQEDDIHRRNMDNRMRKTGMRTYYSPNNYTQSNTRTFYSPTREIY